MKNIITKFKKIYAYTPSIKLNKDDLINKNALDLSELYRKHKYEESNSFVSNIIEDLLNLVAYILLPLFLINFLISFAYIIYTSKYIESWPRYLLTTSLVLFTLLMIYVLTFVAWNQIKQRIYKKTNDAIDKENFLLITKCLKDFK